MKSALKYIFHIIVIGWAMVACNNDDIPDPYQPVTLPKINRLDFISDNDSSIFNFDPNMVLTSGRDNTTNGIKGYEWFTMHYSDAEHKQLLGATYKTASNPSGHTTTREVSYSRDNRNMLSKVTREEWISKSFSFLYDEQYRLNQLTLNEPNVINRYTITYDSQWNVTTVEQYQKASNVEGTFKYEFSGYNISKSNPFYFLINAFYAPVFSSTNGAIIFNKMTSSLGLLLSKNNPGKVIKYEKNGDSWDEKGTETYSYQYLENNNYPAIVSGNGLSLSIEYH